MDLKNGYPYWLIKNGLPFQYPRLTAHGRCDVAIIGGGISGALAAYRLTQQGLSCILLDKRTVGLGSTCASTSLVQYELDKPLSELSTLIGAKQAEKVYAICADAIVDLHHTTKKTGAKSVEKVPSLYFSARPSHMALIEKEFSMRKSMGLPVKLLDKESIASTYGFHAGNAIESNLGLSTDAYLLSHALCRYSINKGLAIYDRTEVARIEERPRSLIVHTADGARVNCSYVVNASGYEAGDFMDKKLVRLMSTYALASEHLEETGLLWKNRAMLWNTADPYLYMRLTNDNRIIVGGRDEALQSNSGRDKLIKRKSSLLKQDFKKLFPRIDLRPEFSWAGTFGVTKDSMPFIGSIKKHPRIFYALGYGGNGILFSHLAAGIIADTISGKKNEAAGLFSFDRA